MALIHLAGGFTLIPEGEHLFTITAVEYKEEFGKLVIKMESKEGKHQEQFNVNNEGALKAFSYFARQVYGYYVEDIDTDALVGKKVLGTITHNKVNDKTYANGSDWKNVEGDLPFEEEEKLSAPTKSGMTMEELNALLDED